MSGANSLVERILTSRFHRLLSKSTAVVRYTGRRSGALITTPVQYARYGSGIVILAADPDQKRWWRNFREDHGLDVLIAGAWVPMTGLAVDPADHPDEAVPLLDAYRNRFPRLVKAIGSDVEPRRILVWCRPC